MDETLGELIRRRRGEAGLSQTKLGKQLGTSRQRVILWERDAHVPSEEYAAKLATAIGGDASDYATTAPAPITLRSDVDELQNLVARLSAAVQALSSGQAAAADALTALADRVDALEVQSSPAKKRASSRARGRP